MSIKGSWVRPHDKKKWDENWDRAFKKKEEVNKYVKVAIERINKKKNNVKKDKES